MSQRITKRKAKMNTNKLTVLFASLAMAATCATAADRLLPVSSNDYSLDQDHLVRRERDDHGIAIDLELVELLTSL